jgi:hypothetical protein
VKSLRGCLAEPNNKDLSWLLLILLNNRLKILPKEK